MNIRTTLMNFFYIILGSLCSLYCFITAFELPISFVQIAPFCILPALLLCTAYYFLGQSRGDIVLLITLLVFGILIFLCRKVILDAIDCTVIYFLQKLSELNVIGSYSTIPLTTKLYSIVLFFCALMALLTMILVILMHRFHHLVLPLLITVPFVEVGLFFGAVPNKTCFFLYVIFVILMIERLHLKKRTVPKGFTPTLTIALVLCLIVSNVWFTHSSYDRPYRWDSIRNAVILKDYDRLSELLGIDLDLVFAPSNYRGINAGDLSSLGNKSRSTRTALEVTLDYSSTTVYLKGYTGSEYEKNHWNTHSDSAYQALQSTYEEQTPLSLSPLELFSFVNTRTFQQETTMTITPKRADKSYAYVPYTMLPNEKVKEIQDLYYQATTRNSYEIPVGTDHGTTALSADYFPELKKDSALSSGLQNYEEYADTLSAYSNSFMEDYLTLPDSVANSIASLVEQIKSKAYASSTSYLEAVKEYLNSYYSYTLQPGKTPSGQDTTLYFLQENKKGYCVHFASSATFLLRALGIPARYVEGYVFSPTNFSSATYEQTTNQYTVKVPESNAHAWTEYYVAGEGWQILDATPGYTSSEIPTDTETISETQNTRTQNTAETTTEQATTEASTTETATTEASGQEQTAAQKDNVSFSQWFGEQPFVVHFLCFLLLTALILFLILLLRRYIVLYLRHRKWHGENANENAIQMLTTLTYLFRIVPPSKAEQEIWKNRMKPFFDLARYSQHTLTKEQLMEIENMVIVTEKKVKKQLPPFKRFYYQLLAKRILR